MSTPQNRPLSRTCLLLTTLALVFAQACSGPATEMEVHEQSGALLYETQRCALCHGADGSSSFWRPGPDLLPHLSSWTVDSLSQYLLDPVAMAADIDRLSGEDMPAYDQLGLETRRRLAEFVLSLGQ